MKKIIITLLVIIFIVLLILFYPYEKMISTDGGSTYIEKSLIYQKIEYGRPPLGSKKYKKGKIITVFGKTIYDDVVILENPEFVKNRNVEQYMKEFDMYFGINKTFDYVDSLLSKIKSHNKSDNYDLYGPISYSIIGDDDIKTTKFYTIKKSNYNELGFIEHIDIIEQDNYLEE